MTEIELHAEIERIRLVRQQLKERLETLKKELNKAKKERHKS